LKNQIAGMETLLDELELLHLSLMT
jgi:hypothetical protein